MPRWSGGKKLTARLVLTLERDQHEALKERAHAARMDVTEYIRSVLFPVDTKFTSKESTVNPRFKGKENPNA